MRSVPTNHGASPLAETLVGWFDREARDLPWRRESTTAWGVLVSEVMLQQTPVVRVLPAYGAWLARWPTPRDLAGELPSEAVRMWGKLGYPGRALRLHACAIKVAERHAGAVPDDLDELLALPGVGPYTARAILAFAFRRRAAAVDTNIRRVLARAVAGQGQAGPPSTARDIAAMEAVLPASDALASRFCAALMELGAVTCTARRPGCATCPICAQCAWRRAGSPDYLGPVARPQRFTGTDRQVRGLLMDVLRAAPGPVRRSDLDINWPDAGQVQRALDSLVADGLIEPVARGRFGFPS
jgi:A/G-specific adenine glycosylase